MLFFSSVGGCYLNCSGRGACSDGVCQCAAGFTGTGCEVDQALCANNCSNAGTCISGVCSCHSGFRGERVCMLMGVYRKFNIRFGFILPHVFQGVTEVQCIR
jgi:hypothetical protein